MPESQYEITLDKLTYGGEAMGRLPDGRAVFVPFGLPGEFVRIQLTQQKQSFARGELLEILKASPDRIEPKCKHFTQCGGCHYQSLPYEKQLAAKTEILRDQLQRIGKIEDPPVKPMVASPLEWNYRNHAIPSHRRWQSPAINAKGNSVPPSKNAIYLKQTSTTFGLNYSLNQRWIWSRYPCVLAKR